jgi:putative flippase GtrA
MDLTPRALVDRYGIKAFRYSVLSVGGVVATETLLILFYKGFGWPGWISNVLAVTIPCLPTYWANRVWVWNKRSAHSLTREVLPFWGMAILGLIISTIAVAIADQYTNAAWVLALANLLSFGVLWVAKFLILEHLMFGDHTHGVPANTPAAATQD